MASYLRQILLAANKKGAGIKSFAILKNNKVALSYVNPNKLPEYFGSRYECIMYIVNSFMLKEYYNIAQLNYEDQKFRKPGNNMFDDKLFFEKIDKAMLGKLGFPDYSMQAREKILDIFTEAKEVYKLSVAYINLLRDRLINKYEMEMNTSSSNKQFVLHKFMTYIEKLRCC